MYIVFILMALFFLLIGIAVKNFKWYFLIAGYNTMTKEEKEKVDIEKTGNVVGNFGYVLFFIQIAASALSYYKFELSAFMISFISILAGVLIVLIKTLKYDGNDKNPDGSIKKGMKILIGAITVFFIILVIAVGAELFYSNKASEVQIKDNYIEIKGLYSTNILINDIEEVSLKETIPKVIKKTNGSNLGSRLKGYFKLKELGPAKLFINKDKPPFIYIKLNQELIIINFDNNQDTENLYKMIEEKVNEKR